MNEDLLNEVKSFIRKMKRIKSERAFTDVERDQIVETLNLVADNYHYNKREPKDMRIGYESETRLQDALRNSLYALLGL